MQNNILDLESYIKDHTSQKEKDIVQYLLDYPGFSVSFFDEKRFDRFKIKCEKRLFELLSINIGVGTCDIEGNRTKINEESEYVETLVNVSLKRIAEEPRSGFSDYLTIDEAFDLFVPMPLPLTEIDYDEYQRSFYKFLDDSVFRDIYNLGLKKALVWHLHRKWTENKEDEEFLSYYSKFLPESNKEALYILKDTVNECYHFISCSVLIAMANTRPRTKARTTPAQEKPEYKKELQAARKQLKKAEARIEKLEAEKSFCKERRSEEVKRMQKDSQEKDHEIALLQKQLEKKAAEIAELKDENEILKAAEEGAETDTKEEITPLTRICFIAAPSDRTGIQKTYKKLLERFPQSEFCHNPDELPQRAGRFDVFVICTRYTVYHGFYWSVRDTLDRLGLPRLHIKSHNPERIAEEIASPRRYKQG